MPHLFVDGAHNPGAMEAFVKSVELLKEKIDVLIFSAVSDKKYDQMIAYICEHLDVETFIVTEIEDWRAVKAEELYRVFKNNTEKEVLCKKELKDALEEAFQRRGEGEIYCLGSLYLVGMIKNFLEGGGINA
jgi:dihydrofolate synthase/folylpolyglutamate synthase